MEQKEFDLRKYLYKNPLFEGEDKEERKKHYRGAEEDDAEHIEALEKDMKYDKKADDKIKENVKGVALRKAIQNEIISILKEQEDEDVDVDVEDTEDVDVDVEDTEDVDVDIEKDIEVDDESAEAEIEVDAELAGEDAETSATLGLLTKAQEEAEKLGDEKLMDQIGNIITYFTRAHVVKSTETRAVAEGRKRRRR